VIAIASATILLLIFVAEAAIGQSFYEGKTITMIAGTEPSAEYKKLVGDDLAPVTGDEIERAIKALKPDVEMIELFKKVAGPDPLPIQ